jgi:hypothetical protein
VSICFLRFENSGKTESAINLRYIKGKKQVSASRKRRYFKRIFTAANGGEKRIVEKQKNSRFFRRIFLCAPLVF